MTNKLPTDTDMLSGDTQPVAFERQAAALGFGMLLQVAVRHQSHGVAQVQLAHKDGAILCPDAIYTQRAFVVRRDVAGKPLFQLSLLPVGKACACGYSLVAK